MRDLPGQGTLLLWDRVGYPCGIVLGEPEGHYPSRTVILKMSDFKEQYSYQAVFFRKSDLTDQCYKGSVFLRSRVQIRLLPKNTHLEDHSS
jgi:hypothetical protein